MSEDTETPEVRRFTPDEAEGYCPAAKSEPQQIAWAKVANRVMNRTHPEGTDPEAEAIKTANRVVAGE